MGDKMRRAPPILQILFIILILPNIAHGSGFSKIAEYTFTGVSSYSGCGITGIYILQNPDTPNHYVIASYGCPTNAYGLIYYCNKDLTSCGKTQYGYYKLRVWSGIEVNRLILNNYRGMWGYTYYDVAYGFPNVFSTSYSWGASSYGRALELTYNQYTNEGIFLPRSSSGTGGVWNYNTNNGWRTSSCFRTDGGYYESGSPVALCVFDENYFGLGRPSYDFEIRRMSDGCITRYVSGFRAYECMNVKRGYVAASNGSLYILDTLGNKYPCYAYNIREIAKFDENSVIAFSSTAFYIVTFDENTNKCKIIASGNLPVTIWTGTYYSSSGGYMSYHTVAYSTTDKILYAFTSPTTIIALRYCNKAISYNVKYEDGTSFDAGTVDDFKITVDGGTITETTDVKGTVCGEDYPTDIIRITATVKVGNLTFTRTKYVANEDGQDVTIYLPDYNTALFYTIFVMDTQNNPLPGYRVIIEKYISDEGAYVSISEAKSGPDGSTSHFLEPSTFYKIKVIDLSGNVVGNYDWYADPNVRTIYIRLGGTSSGGSGSGTEPAQIELNVPWEGITITVPDNNLEVNTWPYTLEISVTDANSSLDAFGGYIAKAIFDQNTPLYDFNVTGNPSGGTIEYNAWTPGLYIISLWIQKNGETYVFPPYQVLLGTKEYFAGPLGISDFTYILIATITTFAVVGFTARFSPGASGILGLVVLGMFTLLNPTATVVGLSLWQIFLITAVFVLGISFVRTYL